MRRLLLLPFFLVTAFLVHEFSRPDLLIVGNITIDIVDGTTPVGGAVSYAAALARVLRVKSCVVTVVGADADLSVFEGHELHVIESNATLTFEHTYTWWGHQRKLRVTANPNRTIARDDVPRHCRNARTVILGPLTLHDIDAGSFTKYNGFWDSFINRGQQIALMAQGFQRGLGPAGRVYPLLAPSQQLTQGLAPQVSVFLSDVETSSWPAGAISDIVNRTARLVVTKGEEGADEFSSTAAATIPVVPVEQAVDTNGAGDTFATMYMIALARGDQDPGATAAWAASRAVLQPQLCKPQCAPVLVTSQIPPDTVLSRLRRMLVPLQHAVEQSLQHAVKHSYAHGHRSYTSLCRTASRLLGSGVWGTADGSTAVIQNSKNGK